MDRKAWTLTATCTLIVAAATLVANPGRAEAQLKKIDAATARKMLSSQRASEPGWWVASNADYRARNDGLPDYYAMRFELAPGGYASTGCMWGGRDGKLLGPFWHFQSAWDPTEGAVLVYWVPRRHDTWVWTPADGREPPVC